MNDIFINGLLGRVITYMTLAFAFNKSLTLIIKNNAMDNDNSGFNVKCINDKIILTPKVLATDFYIIILLAWYEMDKVANLC